MKRPLSSPSSINLKRQYQNLPKLCPNACAQILKYSMSSHFLWEESDNVPVRYSLISEKFRQEAKKSPNVSMCMCIELNSIQNQNQEKSLTCDNKKELDIVLTLLKFTEFPALKFVFFDTSNDVKFGRRLFGKMAYFCRGLREIKSLNKLIVDFTKCTRFFTLIPGFMEILTLSNKQMFVKSIFDVSKFLNGNNIQLEVLEIQGLSFEKCTSNLFKTNAKQLILSGKSLNVLKLHHLEKFCPLPPNPHLQNLDIHVNLMHIDFDSKINTENASSFSHKNSFQFLKYLNPDLTLKLRSTEEKAIENHEEAFVFFEEQIKRATKLIDLAQKFDIKIETFFITSEFRLSFNMDFFECVKNVLKIIDEKFDDLKKSVECRGVKIKPSISFRKYHVLTLSLVEFA